MIVFIRRKISCWSVRTPPQFLNRIEISVRFKRRLAVDRLLRSWGDVQHLPPWVRNLKICSIISCSPSFSAYSDGANLKITDQRSRTWIHRCNRISPLDQVNLLGSNLNRRGVNPRILFLFCIFWYFFTKKFWLLWWLLTMLFIEFVHLCKSLLGLFE